MWRRYWQLKSVFTPRHSVLEARMHLYNISLRRTALWGAGSWRLRVAEARALSTADMEIVWRIVGIPRKRQELWVVFLPAVHAIGPCYRMDNCLIWLGAGIGAGLATWPVIRKRSTLNVLPGGSI